MGWKRAEYSEICNLIKPGDVIAFSGDRCYAKLVKAATNSLVNHVATVIDVKMLPSVQICSQSDDLFIISTSIYNGKGLSIDTLGDWLAKDDDIWWLPLDSTIRQRINYKSFYNFFAKHMNRPYDSIQAARSALDIFDNVPLVREFTHNKEDYRGLFCSELVAGAFEAAKIISHLNASEVTPIDLCRFRIYHEDYYQLRGEEKHIEEYNKIHPDGWGE